MSEGFITRRGGGSTAGSVGGAVIGVIFPEGATVSVSNGTKTYTGKDTDGNTAFAVEAGAWTVAAEQGEDSASKEVTVNEGDFVSVELSFFTGRIYDRGSDYVGLTYVNVEGSGISMSLESDHILLSKVTEGGQSAGFMCAPVDITDYSKLVATYAPANTGTHPFYVAVHDTDSPGYTNGPAASTQLQQNYSAAEKTAELDISSLSGVYYVGIYGKGYGGGALTSKGLKLELS